MDLKEHYLEYDFVHDVTDKGFVEELSLEERDLYYSILEDTEWDEIRSQRAFEDSYYLDSDSLLRYLETTKEEIAKEGIEEDEIVDVVYDRGIKKLEQDGYSVIKTCGYREWFAYKLN